MSTEIPPPAAPAADTVINDFYNKEDYVRRRANFLGRHGDYKNILVFPVARDGASGVGCQVEEGRVGQEFDRRF